MSEVVLIHHRRVTTLPGDSANCRFHRSRLVSVAMHFLIALEGIFAVSFTLAVKPCDGTEYFDERNKE